MPRWLGIVAVFLGVTASALPCSLCQGGLGNRPLRHDLAQASLIVYGTLANPRLNPGDNPFGYGKTDLVIEKSLKSHPILGDGKLLELPRFVPVDPKKPQRLIVSCATYKDRNN